MRSGPSLRLRLLLSAGIAVFLALAAAWLTMTLLFSRHVERRVESDLRRDATQLISELQISPEGVPNAGDVPADPRYEMPTSGLYWQLTGSHGVVRSRSLWDDALPTQARASADRWSTRIANGPFGQRVLIVERSIKPEEAPLPVVVQLAHDVRELRTARYEFARELGLFLILLWLVLTGAAWVQVRIGLSPLRRVREQVANLQFDPGARLTARYPREIEPLTAAINGLADARSKDLERARRRASDLAHSLKTPLAALAAQSRRAREVGAREASEGLDRAIKAVGAAVEAELSRSRAARLRQSASARLCSPHQVAAQIVGVVERTEAAGRLIFEIEVNESLRVPVAEEDLMEILGALIENAARYARRRVSISGQGDGGQTLLAVEDDGPGLRNPEVEIALVRGGKLDEAGPGHGLGLAIVRDLLDATGGELELERSLLGGLKVEVSWSDAPRAV